MSEFPEGFALEWDGQVYRPTGTREHIRKDSTLTRLVDWTTQCPSCGKEFTIRTSLLFHAPRRRCDACKSPRRVKTDRNLFMSQIRGDAA